MILLPEGVIHTDRCFHIENFPAAYPAASHLGAPDEVTEVFPRFGGGTKPGFVMHEADFSMRSINVRFRV